MEGAGTIDVTALAAIGGWVITVVVLLGGVLYRLGHHNSRFDRLERLAADNTENHKEMREEFRQEMREMREEFRQEMRELREENRRNHQQLLQALAHHTHDPNTGFATFQIPPGME